MKKHTRNYLTSFGNWPIRSQNKLHLVHIAFLDAQEADFLNEANEIADVWLKQFDSVFYLQGFIIGSGEYYLHVCGSPVLRMWVSLLIGFLFSIYSGNCRPNGAPQTSCFYMTPRHIHPHTMRRVFPTQANGLYNITTSSDVFRPDRPLRGTSFTSQPIIVWTNSLYSSVLQDTRKTVGKILNDIEISLTSCLNWNTGEIRIGVSYTCLKYNIFQNNYFSKKFPIYPVQEHM